MPRLLYLVAKSTVLTAACILFAVGFNMLRPNGIDLVAQAEYQIYVPCPETMIAAESVTTEAVQSNRHVLYVDVRPREDFRREHIRGAINFPYPLLDGELPPNRVNDLMRRGSVIVTYDGGGRNVQGEMMAALLMTSGIPDVSHLEGGLSAWRKNGGGVEGRQIANARKATVEEEAKCGGGNCPKTSSRDDSREVAQ